MGNYLMDEDEDLLFLPLNHRMIHA